MNPSTRSVFICGLQFAAVVALGADAKRSGLESELEQIRERNGLPALAAAYCIDGKLMDNAATGLRSVTGSPRVTNQDLWHMGSITKAMTATLAATLVEEGKLKWTSTVGETLGRSTKLAGDWKDATLEQLLEHRGGAPAEPPDDLWDRAWSSRTPGFEQRKLFVTGLLSRKPQYPPGSDFAYSNQGYAIAASMMEQVGGQPWEKLIRQRVFEPLGMASAGFGAPGTPGKLDQPLGHDGKKKLTPLVAAGGPPADNPDAIAPAAKVHCTLEDFLKFANWHAGGATPGVKGIRLSEANFARLHQAPSGGDYALGWIVVERDWAGGKALTHDGSNTSWYAKVWIAPKKKLSMVATTNCAIPKANDACDEAIVATLDRAQKALP